jgi:hypothetical protein
MYSGSLYLALASLLEQPGASLEGRRLVFGSYGSGASAKVLSGIVAARYEEIARHLHVCSDLRAEADGGPRVSLSVGDYERLHGLSDAELECGDGVAQKLRDGVPLAAADVAALRDAWQHPTWRVRARGAPVRPPKGEFALSHLGTTSSAQRTDTGYRYYVWVP